MFFSFEFGYAFSLSSHRSSSFVMDVSGSFGCPVVALLTRFRQDEWKKPRCVTDPREPPFPSWDTAGDSLPPPYAARLHLPAPSPVYMQGPPQGKTSETCAACVCATRFENVKTNEPLFRYGASFSGIWINRGWDHVEELVSCYSCCSHFTSSSCMWEMCHISQRKHQFSVYK